MKKLISAWTVKEAFKNGKRKLEAPSKTVMYTPEALSVAKELGMRLVERGAFSTLPATQVKVQIDEALVRKVVERVLDRLPPEKRQMDVVKSVVVDVLKEYAK